MTQAEAFAELRDMGSLTLDRIRELVQITSTPNRDEPDTVVMTIEKDGQFGLVVNNAAQWRNDSKIEVGDGLFMNVISQDLANNTIWVDCPNGRVGASVRPVA